MHPLVAVVMAGIANEDDHRRAREDAAVVDGLLAQALAVPDGSAGSYTLFGGLVLRIERVLGPWVVNFGAEPLVSYREDVRRRLSSMARALFGASGERLVQRPLEPLTIPARTGVARLFRF